MLVFRVAYEVGLLKETPSRQSLIDYGYLEEDLGNDTTFSNYLTNEFKFKDAKEKGKTLWSNELYFEIGRQADAYAMQIKEAFAEKVATLADVRSTIRFAE